MDKSYRILIVHNEYQYAGGEDVVVKQDAELLRKHGHIVFFYLRNNEELNHVSELKKLCLPFTTVFSLRAYREIRELIRKEHIDIVHVHNTLPLISYSCYFAAKKEKVKLIQTIHNFRLVCPNALFYRDGHICEDCLKKDLFHSVKHGCYRGSKLQTFAVAVMLKIHRILGTFQKPDAYIALTDYNKEKISTVVPPEKVFVKPNYLHFLSDMSETDKYDDVEIYFIYVARLEKVKGVFVLLEAFRKWEEESKNIDRTMGMPACKLFLLGTGPDENAVKDFIESNHMETVVCCGFTEHERVLKFMRSARAVIYPSLWYEGFPMTIVESFACSTPVIASDTPNLSEKVRDGENGFLFQMGDAVNLYEKLNALISMPGEDMEKMRKQARKTYETYFTEEIIYGKMMKIYGENY